MEAAADEGLKKYGNDSVLKFFRAYAMILQGRNTWVKINTKIECNLRIFSYSSFLTFVFVCSKEPSH